MSRRCLLVTTIEEFYDGHGSPDTGQIIKEVVIDEDDGKYSQLVEGEEYAEGFLGPRSYFENNDDYDIDEYDWYHNEDEMHEQDGYNCTRTWVTIKVITESEFNHYKLFIDGYNTIP